MERRVPEAMAESLFEKPVSIFQDRSRRSWLLIFGCLLYFAFCWGMYTFTVEHFYGEMTPPIIAADSGQYFMESGVDDPGGGEPLTLKQLVSFGGSSLGPVTIALIGRTEFGVACINCALFLMIVWWAGFIPGVRREVFVLLMALEPQTLPTLMTLNKEILALTGLAAFAAYIYGGQARGKRRGSKWLLLAGLVFSLFARWEQLLIPLWFLAMESRRSPFRGKPWKAIAALLLLASAGWTLGVKVLHLNLGGFIVTVQGGGGMVSRLYAIQERGGFFLVALPKIIMYLAGRWVTPMYFVGDYWVEEFGDNWQNAYIGILSCLAMMAMVGTLILRGRFRLRRPLMHLTLIYFIYTAVNPFIQPRYIYPSYVLMALEMSRKKESLEPVKPLWKPPALPRTYRVAPANVMSGAK